MEQEIQEVQENNEVEMQAPKAKTRMVAPKAKNKLVKIKALRDISVNGNIYLPGSEIEVEENVADEFCKPISGTYNFDGFRRTETATTHQIQRAVRV